MANVQKKHISESELILNPDGSVYHLKVKKGELASNIILVGDQERVKKVTKYFDEIEFKKTNREFVAHTGRIGKKRLSVISTGIGTDNIDIVLNEIDALFNIDFENRTVADKITKINFIRIGTSGTLQPDIDVDSCLVSEFAVGIDALLHFYEKTIPPTDKIKSLVNALENQLIDILPFKPYFSYASQNLLDELAQGILKGITLTAPGFYAPQCRELRLANNIQNYLDILSKFKIEDRCLTNFEMETSGIYGLSNLFGHQAISFNIILANRSKGLFSKNPTKAIKTNIENILERIVSSNI